MRFLNYGKRIIMSIENKEIPFIYFVLTFIFAIALRNFLEVFSTPHGLLSYNTFLHYYSFYICLALTLILLFHIATKERVNKITKVILVFFFIIILAPIVDLIFSLGQGFSITYFIPGKHENILLRFFTFFGSFDEIGVTIGQRIEVGLVLVGSFIYFLIKTKNKLKSLFYSFLVYVLLFLYSVMPFIIIPLVKLLGVNDVSVYFREGDWGDFITNIYLFLIFIFGLIIFYLHSRDYFLTLLKDIRPFRILHYELMLILGIIAGKYYLAEVLKTSYRVQIFSTENFFPLVFVLFSIMLACLFSLMTNNIEDKDIDKISNKGRPLVKGVIPIEIYRKISWIVLLLALIYATVVKFSILCLIFLFIGSYFIYSMPPIRFKRVLYFSKLAPAINSLLIVIIGYNLVWGDLKQFPKNIILYFLIFFTAAMNFIDIKDYRGDKQVNIKTIPTVLGLKRSKLLIGLFFLISYIASYFFFDFPPYFLFFFIILGITQFFLINRKKYSEKPIFIVFFITLLTIFAYFIR